NARLRQLAAGAIAKAEALPANDRERGHVAALQAFAAGEMRHAGRILEDVAIAEPRDLLALQGGQLSDFLTGDARMLRDRIARARPAWTRDLPNYPAEPRGGHAFDDAHAMMAFVGAGREAEAAETLRAMATTAAGTGEVAAVTRDIGLPIAQAIHAYGHGDDARTIELLRSVRNTA